MGLKLSFFDMLEVQERYPGLLQTFDTIAWQIQLVEEQMKGQKGEG